MDKVKSFSGSKYTLTPDGQGNYDLRIYTNKQSVKDLFDDTIASSPYSAIEIRLSLTEYNINAIAQTVRLVAERGDKVAGVSYRHMNLLFYELQRNQSDDFYLRARSIQPKIGIYFDSICTNGVNVLLKFDAYIKKSPGLACSIALKKLGITPADELDVKIQPSALELENDSVKLEIYRRIVAAYVDNSRIEEGQYIYELNKAIKEGSTRALKIIDGKKLSPNSHIFSYSGSDDFSFPLLTVCNEVVAAVNCGAYDKKREYLAEVAKQLLANGFCHGDEQLIVFDDKEFDALAPFIREHTGLFSHIGGGDLYKGLARVADQFSASCEQGFSMIDFIDKKIDLLVRHGQLPDTNSLLHLARGVHGFGDDLLLHTLKQYDKLGAFERQREPDPPPRRSLAGYFITAQNKQAAIYVIENKGCFTDKDRLTAEEYQLPEVVAAIESKILERIARTDGGDTQSIIRRTSIM